jgi:hypothetical protein
VKLEFSAVHITEHPISDELVENLLSEAEDIYEREQEFLRTNKNKDIDDFDIDRSALLKPLPQQTDKNSDGETDKHTEKNEPQLRNVVMKAKGVDSVQKAVKNYRNNRQTDNQSKGCVIL